MLRTHSDAIEADLQRFYGIDLGDLWRGGLSARRLSVLIAHLPPGSATWSVLHNIPAGWQLTDFLLADLYQAFTGKEHPSRPKPTVANGRTASHVARLRAQRDRLAALTAPAS